MSEELIPQRGNYKKLRSYQKTDVIFQLTYYFCHTYLQKGDRTIWSMGCMASGTSAKTELKLLNVAKASLHELNEDFEDYLKTRGHRQWEEGSAELEAMRRLGRDHQ